MTSQRFGSRTSATEITQAFSAEGKKIIVTGANAGIGFATARALAGGGAEVIFACRNLAKGESAIAQTRVMYPDCKAELRELDLSSFASIRQFARDLEWEHVDVLICNAGLFAAKYQETAEGLEQTVGVCHFGHFLLFHELLDKLQAAKEPRLVVVASESHRTPPKLDLDNFPLPPQKYRQFTAYGQAKLANVMFANEVQRRYGADGISACSLHPGALVTTEIGNGSALTRLGMKLVSPFTKNIDQGAATSVYCALVPDVRSIQGNYFSHCQRKTASKEARNLTKSQWLWEKTKAMLEQLDSVAD